MNQQNPLKIILSKKGTSSEGGREKMPGTLDNVTAACPEHLTLANLPVAKSIGSVPGTTRIKQVGFSVPRKPGEKVHFCVRCDYPIAIYGRLSPCEHALCMDCARSNSNCFICGVQIQKIQAIKKVKGGIFLCGLRSCLKSFLEENALKSHIVEVHGVTGSSSVNNGGNGDLQLLPVNGPLPGQLHNQVPELE